MRAASSISSCGREELDLADFAQVELDGGVAVIARSLPLARGERFLGFRVGDGGRLFHWLGFDGFLSEQGFRRGLTFVAKRLRRLRFGRAALGQLVRLGRP